MPYLGRGRAVQPRAQRRQRTFLHVPPAHQPGRPRRRQPRLREPCPPLGRGLLQPLVVGRGGRVPLVGLAVGGQQARRVGEFDPEGGDRLGDVEGDGGPLQITDTEPARPQHRGPALVPVLQQLLDGRQGGVRLPGRRSVHNLWTVRGGGLHRGRQRLGGPVRPAAAQMQGHLPGQYDRPRRGRQQQPPVEEPAQMGRGIGGDLAERRPPHQPGQHLPRLHAAHRRAAPPSASGS